MSTNIFAKDIIYITYNVPYLYEKRYRYVVITYPVYFLSSTLNFTTNIFATSIRIISNFRNFHLIFMETNVIP